MGKTSKTGKSTKGSEKGSKKRARKRAKQERPDLHSLYEAAVQNVEADVDFILKRWRKARGGQPQTLREDFCGTASLAAEWVRTLPDGEAWGVDLDRGTLDWGLRHRIAPLGNRAERVHLEEADVLVPKAPRVDVQVAFNFSYQTFRRRADLVSYFRAVYESLDDGGMFFLDSFGGTDALCDVEEKTKISKSVEPDGRRVPAFLYIWEQKHFNALDHSMDCRIHFRLKDGRRIRNAFRYTWRMWSLPEMNDLLTEAGFETVDFYVEGWDDETDEPDGIFKKRKRVDNEGSWIAYVVASKPC